MICAVKSGQARKDQTVLHTAMAPWSRRGNQNLGKRHYRQPWVHQGPTRPRIYSRMVPLRKTGRESQLHLEMGDHSSVEQLSEYTITGWRWQLYPQQ